MKILRLLLPLLTLPFVAVQAQEIEPPEGTRINSAIVSGVDLDRLSPGLQDAIGKLVGSALSRRELQDLAARIETEQPRFIAGVRASQEADGGARVVFVVARLRDQEREANINSRYVVEDVEIKGVSEGVLDQALRDDLHALAGKQLDSDAADRLEERLKQALPEYTVMRRTVRGSQQGNVRLVFLVDRVDWLRWLRFEPHDANLIYHSDQGWGARLPLAISMRDVQIAPIVAIDVGDDLIEEYSGFGVRVETRRLGTERLGAFFEWSTYDQTWRDATLAALPFHPGVPQPYRNRMSVTPLLKFAVTQQLTVAGGVRITELDPQFELGETRMANAALASVSFTRGARPDAAVRHVSRTSTLTRLSRSTVDAAFTLRAGTESLESDLDYQRYLGQGQYSYHHGRHEVRASGLAGRINGDAPLFERFSLGDSRTLRGWDKYDIAPAGGDRVYHTSLEYQYRGFGLFVDAGAVWDDVTARKARVSTGVTFNPGPVFFTLGFPVNTDEFRAVFTMGFRASIGIGKY